MILQVRSPALKIFQRYHFSSALKRMAVVAGYSSGGALETHYIASVKGIHQRLPQRLIFYFFTIFFSVFVVFKVPRKP